MYSLLGLIQLLMLTQSRLLPDLGGLFNPPPPQTEAVYHLPVETKSAAGSTTVYRRVLETIQSKRNTEKWIPPVCRNKIVHRVIVKSSLGRNRIVTGDKLYLVFCQWKTEG